MFLEIIGFTTDFIFNHSLIQKISMDKITNGVIWELNLLLGKDKLISNAKKDKEIHGILCKLVPQNFIFQGFRQSINRKMSKFRKMRLSVIKNFDYCNEPFYLEKIRNC